MPDEKELLVRIRYTQDDAGAKEARKTGEQLRENTKSTGQAAVQSVGHTKELTNRMNDLLKVSSAVALISGAMFAGVAKSISQYTNQVGASEATSKRWMIANQNIEMSTTRIGRVFTEQAAPYLEKFGGFMNQTADFLEKHPEVADAGLKVLGGAAVLGGAGTVVSVGSKLIAGVKGLAGGIQVAAGGINAAGGVGAAAYGPATATAAAAGTAAATIAAVGGGVGLGLIANEALANSDIGKKMGVQNLSKWAVALSYLFNRLGGQSEAQATAGAGEYGQSIGAIPGGKQAPAAPAADQGLGQNLAQQVLTYNQYYRQEEQALRAHLIQLSRSQRDFSLQQEYEQADYDRQRSRSIRDMNRQLTIDEFQFSLQRYRQTRDFNIQVTRAEQDYNRQRAREAQDHQFQLWDILRSGDALAYMQSQRQYNLSRSREEEDYSISRQRQLQDFSRSQADEQQDFAIQRQLKQQEFAIQLADAQQDFDIRRKRELEQRRIQLQDMKQDFEEQERMRKQAVVDALNTMADGTEKAKLLLNGFTGSMVADMQTLANSAVTLHDYFKDLDLPNSSIPGRDMGGYVGAGLYRMHPHEFVMRDDTTTAAERVVKGRLNQDNLLAALAGGGGTTQIVVNDNRHFDSRLSNEDRRFIQRDTEDTFGRLIA